MLIRSIAVKVVDGAIRIDERTVGVRFPLYALLLAIAIPTLLVWRFVPKFPPGHCPCGYDLRGNVSGVCPECGKKATHADA